MVFRKVDSANWNSGLLSVEYAVRKVYSEKWARTVFFYVDLDVAKSHNIYIREDLIFSYCLRCS